MTYTPRKRSGTVYIDNNRFVPYERNVAADSFVWTPGSVDGFAVNTFVIEDESHGRGPYRGGDKGGDFFLWKKETPQLDFPTVSGSNFRGRLFPGLPSGFNWTELESTDRTAASVMDARGTTAIARIAPENPSYNALGFFGELLQGVPRLIGSTLKEATSIFKKIGDEYLNGVFGWLPFVDDVREMSQVIGNSSEIIKNYVTHSGTLTRRNYRWPPVRTTRTYVSGGYCGDYLCNITSTNYATEVITDEWSFSGAFRYYVPVDSRLQKAFDDQSGYARSLFEAQLTPEVLWELTPWSWAVDWFTNVGDVMKNIDNFGTDGLVMQYGYITRRRVMTRQLKSVVLPGNGIPAGTSCSWTTVRTVVERRKATPYGFGLDELSFSKQRLAILAALGLSKGAR